MMGDTTEIGHKKVDELVVEDTRKLKGKKNSRTRKSRKMTDPVIIVNGDKTTDYENERNSESENEEDNHEENNDYLVMEVDYDEIIEELYVWDNEVPPLEKDEKMVQDFLGKECCKRKCNTKFKSEELLLYRLELQSLDYNEHGVNQLDLVLLGLIHSLCRVSNEIRHSRTIKKMPRRRIKMMFGFRGVSVCRAMFMFAHAIKIERLKRLLKHYKEEGISPKPHGNYKRVPANAITVEQIRNVVAFLRQYAKENAVVVPGRSAYQNQDIKLLPPQETKLKVYNKYKETRKNSNCISVVSFRRLWNRFCPDIVIQRPENNNRSTSPKVQSSSVKENS